MSQLEEKRWYAWVIKRNRFDNVRNFIKNECPEVDHLFYPQARKEYSTKRGTRTKETPLYEGYLFLRYDNPSVVFHRLKAYPFITTFAGIVEEQEIKAMEKSQGKLISEIRVSKFSEGETVRLLNGPFKGMDATIISVDRTSVRALIDTKFLGKEGVEVVCNEEEIEKKSQIVDAKVQAL